MNNGTYVGCIEGLNAMVVPKDKAIRDSLESTVLETGLTYANLMCLIASSSGSTQSCQPFEPYDIQPRMIFETLSPDFPRRTITSHPSGSAGRDEHFATYHIAFLGPWIT